MLNISPQGSSSKILCRWGLAIRVPFFLAGFLLVSPASWAGNVYVSRFWHNHQPIYWPEWNNNGNQTNRVQYAWDSIVLKPGQTYGGITGQHPENNLADIFGLQDRVTSYQSGPRNSLTTFNSAGGFAISYSGSLIDNIRQLGSVGQLGYGSGWNSGYKDARSWKTPAGSTRMDLVGFTYHHSLAPLLPKSVFRKELQIFKQAWWKAWGGKSDTSDHSRGYFPTEMAYSRHLIDVLVDEGYQWVIVPSHHISRTCPTYNNQANPLGSYNIYSSPPNKADQLGPSPTSGWWYSEPNPGNAAWNVAPYAYQLWRVKYVNPETGAEKTMIAVPSDDVLSYRYGYANEGVGKIDTFIAPYANDALRPLFVMPATDGDNAWGGGSSSWMEATPQLFNDSAARGYQPSTPQDFVNAHGANAPLAHIEDGAWIFPEMDYGSPNFMKWIEPPVASVANRGKTTVPGTQIDMETPGFALKFYSYAPLMAGANWCETAEQIWKDESTNNTVQAWKIQAPYDWDGTWTSPNEVEQAWHIYLTGLDSGFNYYGGLGNDDEIKPSLATRRAVEKLTPWMTATRRNNDRTGPTVLKPQRFPYNPGWYTFGWFNQQPQIPNNAFLKRMNSEFYIWTHAYDLSGIPDGGVKLKVRFDLDGVNPINSNQNETYAGGNEVGSWQTIAMTMKGLPKTREALNAAAADSRVDYFFPVQSDAVADYYFAKITDTNLPGFRNKLLDYYIEATDSKGNISKSEIQHVWVDDYSGASNDSVGGGGGGATNSNSVVSLNPAIPVAGQALTITYNPVGGKLAAATTVNIHHGFNQNITANWTPLPGLSMSKSSSNWICTYTVASNATTIAMCFNNGSGIWDNNGGGNWNFNVTNTPITNVPMIPTGLSAKAIATNMISLQWDPNPSASGYSIYRDNSSSPIAVTSRSDYLDTTCIPDTTYVYRIRATNSYGYSEYSPNVTVVTPIVPLSNNLLVVTTPAPGVPTTSQSTSFLYRGYAGSKLTNGIRWSNALTQQGGVIPFSGDTNPTGWVWTVEIPLGTGSNNVTFSADYLTVMASSVAAQDSPLDPVYAGPKSWTAGLNGGKGFASWSFIQSTSNSGSYLADLASLVAFGKDQASSYAGSNWTALATETNPASYGFLNWTLSKGGTGDLLITNPASAGGISGMGAKAFCLKAPGTNSGNYATAQRKFQYGPLQNGESLSFLWGINYDGNYANLGNKGFVLLAQDETTELLVVNNSSNANITLREQGKTPTPFLINYGTNAMRWTFQLLSATNMRISAQNRNDTNQVTSTNVSISQSPASLKLYASQLDINSFGGGNDCRSSFFDDFRLLRPNLNLSNGSCGFGLWANNGGQIKAVRQFERGLLPNDRLMIDFDNNLVSATNNNGQAGKVGISLEDTNGISRFRFYFIGGETNYRIDDQYAARQTQFAYTSQGMSLSFLMSGANTYVFSNGGNQEMGTLGLGGSITRLIIFNESAGPDTDYNLYVGDIKFQETPVSLQSASIAATSILPSSTDGIPNSWWIQYFGTTAGASASADSDGDGFTNMQEHALGTDPKSAASTFKVGEMTRSGGSLTITWPSVAGKRYQVQTAPQLSAGAWQNAGDVVAPSVSGTSSVTVSVSADAPACFVRVNLLP